MFLYQTRYSYYYRILLSRIPAHMVHTDIYPLENCKSDSHIAKWIGILTYPDRWKRYKNDHFQNPFQEETCHDGMCVLS